MKRTTLLPLLLAAAVLALASIATADAPELMSYQGLTSLSAAGPSKAPYDGPPPKVDPARAKTGGDNIGSATPIGSVPYSDTGTTTGFINDYDEVCPYDGSTAPDVVYSYQPAVDTFLFITLCNDSTNYDTKLYVYEDDTTTLVDCNDDACGTVAHPDSYVSELECVPVNVGHTYYIVVDGYSTASGFYDIYVDYCIPCQVYCPPSASLENEPCGTDANGGCHMVVPTFEPINCGDTVCGTAWADTNWKDTDWYELYLSGPTQITVTGSAEFPFMVGFVDTSDCDLFFELDPSATGEPCDTVSASRMAGPGTYWMFVAATVYTGYPCGTYNDYWAALTCEPPQFDSAIVLDTVYGLNANGKLIAGQDIKFMMRWIYSTGDTIAAYVHGFRVYSPDGATWQPIILDTVSVGWPDLFEHGPFINYFGATGTGADTAYIAGVRGVRDGIIPPFDTLVWWIETRVSADDTGKHLCLDSSFFPPAGHWSWTNDSAQNFYPHWSGPHCFEITSSCCNHDGIRGDANGDETINIVDAVYIISYIFLGGPPPDCPEEADANADGFLSVSDVRYLVNFMYHGGPPPPDCDSSTQPGGGAWGEVEVRLNGGDNVAYIGQTNTVEFHIANSASIKAMSLGFEFDIATAYTFDPAHGGPGSYVGDSVNAAGFFDLTGLREQEGINDTSPDSILLGGAALMAGVPPGGLRLSFTMQFDIPPGENPQTGGVCITPVFYPPEGTWTFDDGTGSYPPDFNGQTTPDETSPAFAPICFDIVPWCFPGDPPLIKIEKVPAAPVGQVDSVSITTRDVPFESGGFDLLVSYDTAVLSVIEATAGQLLEDCMWEQFSYGAGPGPGLLRIEAIADIENGDIHPLCYGPPDTDPHELLKIEFQVIGLPTGGDSLTPIDFYWIACQDNSFRSVSEETTYVDRRIYDIDGNLIWNEDDDDSYPEHARIPFVGAPDTCLDVDPDSLAPLRAINFQHGGIVCVSCCNGDGIRGDVKGNGGINIADLTYLVDFLFKGGPAPPCFEEGDVNGNGKINVADLTYLVSYLFKGGPAPLPCP